MHEEYITARSTLHFAINGSSFAILNINPTKKTTKVRNTCHVSSIIIINKTTFDISI